MSARHESDLAALHKEREAQGFKISASPFHPEDTAPNEEEEQEELLENEVRAKAPFEVKWTDLLLEISMTTAFSSLTDGTPILQTNNAISYVCYFAFVWWIWVSQVAYNMRFRQADILHRVWMVLQLAVFGALAAFTKDFDITTGLTGDNPDQQEAQQLINEFSNNTLSALQFREHRLPILNARGLSMVMALSRLLLLAQYLVVFYHAKHLKRKSLLVHISSLVIAFICYLSASVMLLKTTADSSHLKAVMVAKIVLWYLPIVLEIGSHYWALHLAHFVRYSSKAISDRIGTVFLIILGAGLDKITGGFKTIIGNGGLGWDGVPLFIAAFVIFVGTFTLYFGTPGSTSGLGRKRILTWFFSQFFFISALIIMLQGVANSLQFSNINDGIIKTNWALQQIFTIAEKNPGVNLTDSDFNDSGIAFRKLGVSPDDVAFVLNAFQQYNDTGILKRAEVLLEVLVIDFVLQTFEASPDPNSLLGLELYYVENSDPTDPNSTYWLNDAKFWEIRERVVQDRGSSGLWFYPAAGSTILALGLMPFFKARPRGKWEFGFVLCRILVGISAILLGLLNIGYKKPIYDENGNLTSSIIWRLILSEHQLQLIIMAIAIGVLLLVEFSFAYLANRSYLSREAFPFSGGTNQYEERTNDIDIQVGHSPLGYRGPVHSDEPYNPYREVPTAGGMHV